MSCFSLLSINLSRIFLSIEKLGFVFLEKLKDNPKTQNIPVVVFTNLNSIEAKKKGLSLGANEYLAKGEKSPQEVLVVVEKLID